MPCRSGRTIAAALSRAGCDRGISARNAATGAGDVFVADALQSQLELSGPLAAVDQMGVAVDQARRDPAPLQLHRAHGLELRRFRARADPDDAAVADGDDRVFDGAVGRAADGHGRRPASGQKEVDPLHAPVLPPAAVRE